MTVSGYDIGLEALITHGAGIGGVAVFGTGRVGDRSDIVMIIGIGVVTCVAVSAFTAGVSGVTTGLAGRFSNYSDVIVTEACDLVIDIGI